MMLSITVDSFGAEVPKNWEEIASFLNAAIEERGLTDSDDINELWEQYWNGIVPDAPEPVIE